MSFLRQNSLVVIALAALLLCQRGPVGAQIQPADNRSYDDRGYMYLGGSGTAAGEPADVQMARAIAAGPSYVTNSARIVGADALGKGMVLREGSNGFTCQPGNPALGRPASCANDAARQWAADLAAPDCRSPTATRGRISCGRAPAPLTCISWARPRSRCGGRAALY